MKRYYAILIDGKNLRCVDDICESEFDFKKGIKDYGGKIIYVGHIDSLDKIGKCRICRKPFRVGDEVYSCGFSAGTVEYIWDGEIYLGKYNHGKPKYFVHKHDILIEKLNEYKASEMLVDWGRDLSQKLRKEIFND